MCILRAEDLLGRAAAPDVCLNHQLKSYSQQMINTPIPCGALDHSNPPAVPPSNLTACFRLNNTYAAYQLSNILLELSKTCVRFQSSFSLLFILLVCFHELQRGLQTRKPKLNGKPASLPLQKRNVSKAIIDKVEGFSPVLEY